MKIITKKRNSNLDIYSFSSSKGIPGPISLEKYNTIIPDGANRIMTMLEKEQENRHKKENKLIDRKIFQTKSNQWFGFLIGLVTLGCGTYLAIIGETTVGGILLGATILGLVGVFVIGKFYYPNNSA